MQLGIKVANDNGSIIAVSRGDKTRHTEIVAPNVGMTGQPYLLIPTPSGEKIAVPFYTKPFDVRQHKSTEMYKLLCNAISALLYNNKQSNKNQKDAFMKHLDVIEALLQVEKPDDGKIIEEKGDTITLHLQSLTDANQKYDVTIQKTGDTVKDALAIVDKIPVIPINVSLQYLNNKIKSMGLEKDYNKVIGEIADVSLPENTTHTVNGWFTIELAPNTGIKPSKPLVPKTTGIVTEFIGGRNIEINTDNYTAVDTATGEIIEGDEQVNLRLAQIKASKPMYKRKDFIQISIEGDVRTYDVKNNRFVKQKEARAEAEEARAAAEGANKEKESLRKEGDSILRKLGYKSKDRHSNGHVRGGQSGWKLRFIVKNPTTGKAFTQEEVSADKDAYLNAALPLLNWLKEYFSNPDGSDTISTSKPQSNYNGYAAHYHFTDKDGHSREPFKFLTGGEVGEADFTIYIGSIEDVEKFMSDVEDSPIKDALAVGNNNKSDVDFNGKIHGRIEGRSIGFSGYMLPDGLNKMLPEETTVYEDGRIRIYISENEYLVEDKKENKFIVPHYTAKTTPGSAQEYVNKNILHIRNTIARNVYGNFIARDNSKYRAAPPTSGAVALGGQPQVGSVIEIDVPTMAGGTRKEKVQKVSVSELKIGDVIWRSGTETEAPISRGTVMAIERGNLYVDNALVPRATKALYRVVSTNQTTPSGKTIEKREVEMKQNKTITRQNKDAWAAIPDNLKLKLVNEGASIQLGYSGKTVVVSLSNRNDFMKELNAANMAAKSGGLQVSEAAKPMEKDSVSLSKEKEREARRWLAKNLPSLSSEERTQFVERIARAGQNANKVWGSYKAGVIEIQKGAPVGTVYHEAFHYVVDMILDAEEKKMLLDVAKEEYGITDDWAAEERLANDFRRYALDENTTGITGRIKRWMRRLWDRITRYNRIEDTTKKQLFWKINNGELAQRSQEAENFEETRQAVLREIRNVQKEKNAWSNLNRETKQSLKDSGLSEAAYNNMSLEEKEQWLKCRT